MSSDFSSVRQNGAQRLERFGEDLIAALLFPFSTVPKAILTLVLSVLTFGVLILLSQPQTAYQMFVTDLFTYSSVSVLLESLQFMLVMNYEVTLMEYGWSAIALTVLYALLTGIALTNTIALLQMLQIGSLANLGGILPGVVAAGCASCGPGLFALVGLTGAVTFIPFQGTILRVAGIGLILFFLGRAGDPRECRI